MSLAATSPMRLLRQHGGIAAILLLALAIRLWQLDQNGWGTEYYAAAVRSMLESWHNFFFNAFDPAGFVSIDKPPVAFWIQAAFAGLLGFSSFSLLLPQVLEGAAGILILYHLVHRRFGLKAALLAALVLALTPISVAVDRANNTDACLVLVLLLAGWTMSLAVERGSFRWLVAALVLVGLGFNVKMLAACVVLPGFTALYLYAAPVGLARRALHLAGAGVVFAVVALSWSVVYDIAAPDSRPYVDSTAENSMLELAIGHNGVQRFLPRLHRNRPETAQSNETAETPDATAAPADPTAAQQRRQAISALRRLDNPPAGPLRLANRHLAGQLLWLLPLALIGFGVGLRRAGFTRPVAPQTVSLLLWFGWALTYGAVYSVADGIFHTYYLVTMAPPLAALAGIALVELRQGWKLPAALAATAAWQAYIEAPYIGAPTAGNWRLWLFCLLLAGTGLGALGLLSRQAGLRREALALALVALLVTPAA